MHSYQTVYGIKIDVWVTACIVQAKNHAQYYRSAYLEAITANKHRQI